MLTAWEMPRYLIYKECFIMNSQDGSPTAARKVKE